MEESQNLICPNCNLLNWVDEFNFHCPQCGWTWIDMIKRITEEEAHRKLHTHRTGDGVDIVDA